MFSGTFCILPLHEEAVWNAGISRINSICDLRFCGKGGNLTVGHVCWGVGSKLSVISVGSGERLGQFAAVYNSLKQVAAVAAVAAVADVAVNLYTNLQRSLLNYKLFPVSERAVVMGCGLCG